MVPSYDNKLPRRFVETKIMDLPYQGNDEYEGGSSESAKGSSMPCASRPPLPQLTHPQAHHTLPHTALPVLSHSNVNSVAASQKYSFETATILTLLFPQLKKLPNYLFMKDTILTIPSPLPQATSPTIRTLSSNSLKNSFATHYNALSTAPAAAITD
jgi:hypothetical protein